MNELVGFAINDVWEVDMATTVRQVRIKRAPAAELRLQAALAEMDKLDILEEDSNTEVLENYDYSGPRRQWFADVD